jgi:uncharacterized membrane protein
MTDYNLLLWIHVTAAAIWVGGAFATQMFALRALATKDGTRMANFAADAEWAGTRVFMPASIVVLVIGIALVLNGDWGFSRPWILIGLGGILATVITGAGFLGPESGRLKELIATKGPDDPQVTDRIKRILAISRIDLAVLLFILFDMTVKPFS